MPKIRRDCLNCGADVFPTKQQIKNGQGKYCSHSCRSQHMPNPMKADPNKKKTLTCPVCKKVFTEYKKTIKRLNIRYCSKKCGGIARRGKYEPHNKKEVPVRYCDNCGEKIPRNNVAMKMSQINTMGKKNMFCNLQCSSDFQKNRVKRKCVKCGIIFEITVSALKAGKGAYCSMKCLSDNKREIRECESCGDKFEERILSDKRYCSQRCHYDDRILYPKTSKLRMKVKELQKIRGLKDQYIKSVINSAHGIKFKDIPKELIELKRLNIKRKRKLKEITHGNSQ